MSQSKRRFFGLTLEEKFDVQMEQVFNLMCYLGFSYTDARKLPIQYRGWFINRLNAELKKNSEETGDDGISPSYETQQMRAMQGKFGQRKF